MKIAFLGKGGTGKSTLTAATATYLEQNGDSSLVIDADVNAHTDELLGVEQPSQSLAEALPRFKEQLERRDDVPPLGSFPVTDKTQFINEVDHPILDDYKTKQGLLRYAQVGSYEDHDVNTGCYHEKLDSLEFLLHRMREDSHVLIDGTAGTDFAVSTLSFAVDAIIFVIEPTNKSLGVYHDYQDLISSQPMQVPTHVVWNNIEATYDTEFLTGHADQPIGVINRSSELKRFNQTGEGFNAFVNENQDVFHEITSINAVPRDQAYKEALHEAFSEEWESWGEDYFGDIL